MTAKRFVINSHMNLDDKVETYDLSCIVDNDNKTFYFVVDSIANVELFIKRLNELVEENERLKESIYSWNKSYSRVYKENERLKYRIKELELLNDGLNYALQNIRKIDVEIDVGDNE